MTLPQLPERVARLRNQRPYGMVEAILNPAVGVFDTLQRLRSKHEDDEFIDVEAAASVPDSDIDLPGAVGFANVKGLDEIYRVAPGLDAQAFYCIERAHKNIRQLWKRIVKARRSNNRRREEILARKLEKEIPLYQKLVTKQQKINTFRNPSKWVLERLSQVAERNLGKDAIYMTGQCQDYVNIHNKDELHILARSLLEVKLTQWLSWWSRESIIETNNVRYTAWSEKSIDALKIALVLSATLVLVCMPVILYSLGIVSSPAGVASLYAVVVVIGGLVAQVMFDFTTFTVVTLGLAALVGNSISKT